MEHNMPRAIEPSQYHRIIAGLVTLACAVSKTGHVEIADCGDGTPCGTLVWVQTDQNIETPLDIYNKDPELAKRPLIGSQMLYGFKSKKSKWKGGKIYNAADGKTYGSSLKRIDEDTLQVKGCVGPICQKQIWTRVTPQL